MCCTVKGVYDAKGVLDTYIIKASSRLQSFTSSNSPVQRFVGATPIHHAWGFVRETSPAQCVRVPHHLWQRTFLVAGDEADLPASTLWLLGLLGGGQGMGQEDMH